MKSATTFFGILMAMIPFAIQCSAMKPSAGDLNGVVNHLNSTIGAVSNPDLSFVQTFSTHADTKVKVDIKKTTDRGITMNRAYILDLKGLNLATVQTVKEGRTTFVDMKTVNADQLMQMNKKGEVTGSAEKLRIAANDADHAARITEAIGQAWSVANGGQWSEDKKAVATNGNAPTPRFGFQWEATISDKCGTLRPDFANQPYWIGLTDCKKVSSFEKVAPQQIARATGMYSSEGLFYIPGISSSVRFRSSSPIACVVKVDPEGSDPSDLMVIREFQVNKKSQNRELVTTKNKVGSSTVKVEDIPMSFVKVAPGYFLITTEAVLTPGEYAFFNTAKTFCFAFGVE
jgi:hypothetical protein